MDPRAENRRRSLIRSASARVLAQTGQLDEAEQVGRRATESGSAPAWHALGDVLSRADRIDEALAAYVEALMAGDYPPDQYRGLARALGKAGRDAEAVAVLELWADRHVDDPVAAHLLGAVTGRETPPRASDAYIEAEFRGFADGFDETMERLEYAVPGLVRGALTHALDTGTVDDLLDLGCGTGLCGAAVAQLTRRLVGVDLSGPMLERCAQREVYDELHEAELTNFLEETPERFDAIVAADSLVYFGDLAPVFTGIHRCLRPGGVAVLTLEAGDPASGFALAHHGRYLHAELYVKERLSGAGMIDTSVRRAVLRTEGGDPVTGLVVTARRPNPSAGVAGDEGTQQVADDLGLLDGAEVSRVGHE